MNKIKPLSLLCVELSMSSIAAWASDSTVSQFPGAGMDNTRSLGQFALRLTTEMGDKFGIPNCPGDWKNAFDPCAIWSPVLDDFNTQINRSAPHQHGDNTDDDTNLEPFPSSGFVNGPAGTPEVHTQILSLNMTQQQPNEFCYPTATTNEKCACSGESFGAFAVRAGNTMITASSKKPSFGEVESLNQGNDFPAESFFNMFVEVDLDWPPFGNVDMTVYNPKTPLTVQNPALQDFPPQAVYIHGGSKNDGAPPVYDVATGDMVGWIVLAGHGLEGSGTGFCELHRRFKQAIQDRLNSDPSILKVTPLGVPEINIQGNGLSIPSGDISPSSNDNTDFGTVELGTTQTHFFTIQNTGPENLNLMNVELMGTECSGAFSARLSSTMVAPAGTATLELDFTSTTTTPSPCTVSIENNDIANNDGDENPYTFLVTGRGASSKDPQPLDPPFPRLYLEIAGSGSGRVTSDTGLSCHTTDCPNQVCNDNCFDEVPAGTLVTLTPQPDAGSTFSAWGGHPGCASGQIWMAQGSKLCTAYFQKLPPPPLPSTEPPPVVIPIPNPPTETPPTDTQPATEPPVPTPESPHPPATESPPPISPPPTEVKPLIEVIPPTDTNPPPSPEPPAPPPQPATTPLPVTVEVLNSGGAGEIRSEPLGIVCGPICKYTFPPGTSVKLTAFPTEGFIFNGWSGEDCETVTSSSKSCVAQFIKAPSSSGPLCSLGKVVEGICNAQGQILQQELEIHEGGNLSNAVVIHPIHNHGWTSNLLVKPSGSVEGGTLTGYIQNEGQLVDFEFRGTTIRGGMLGGEVTNISKVGGYFQDVHLAANTRLSGGRLKGQIIGEINAPALLDNLTILAGSHLSGVKLGEHVIIQKHVVIDPLPVAQPLPALGLGTIHGPQAVQTTTQFSGGIAVNGEEFKTPAEVTRFLDVVKILGKIQPEHVGQVADLIIYITYQPAPQEETYYFMLDEHRAWWPWDTQVSSLVAFRPGIILPEEIEVELYHGILMVTGVVNLYFGYHLADGSLIENSSAIKVQVVE